MSFLETSADALLRRGRWAALLGITCLWSPDAAAFMCTRANEAGPNLAWPSRTITLARSGVGDELSEAGPIDEALAHAAAAWTDLDCSDIEVRIGEPTRERITGFDWFSGAGAPENKNILVFRNSAADDPLDAWVHDLGALAITTVTFESYAGRLLDADIEINDATFEFSACSACDVDFDLENTLTHEIGHVLGLDHSRVVDATMFASAPRGDVSKRTLDPDDENALCLVYPASGPTGLCDGAGPRSLPPEVEFSTVGCAASIGTVRQDAHSASASAWPLVGLLGAVAVRRRLMFALFPHGLRRAHGTSGALSCRVRGVSKPTRG